MWTFLVACVRPTLPEPVVERTEPTFAWSGEPTAIRIVGEGFFPLVDVSPRGDAVAVNPSYQALLVGPDELLPVGGIGVEELEGVQILDEHTLSATVPAGLASGTWDLVVESPTGLRSVLESGFRITDQQAAQLALTPLDPASPAGESQAVRIELLDLDGELVDLGLGVTVDATHDQSDAAVGVLPGTLVAESTHPGGVDGFLSGGQGTVYVSADTPGAVALSVRPTDRRSPILADSVPLVFEVGADLSLALRLEVPGPFVAGETFLVAARLEDQYGNLTLTPVSIGLRTTCSGWSGRYVVRGETTLTVGPRVASFDACPEDRVEVTDPSGLATSTPPYVVEPGPPTRLKVRAVPLAGLHAGGLASVSIQALDAFENVAAWHDPVLVTDSLGGTEDVACYASDDQVLCQATPLRAGAVTFLAASTLADGSTIGGASNPIQVLPGEIPTSVAVEAVGPAVAGEALPVRVAVLDAYGNVMDGAAFPDVAVTDELGDADCVRTGQDTDGAPLFDCVFEVARGRVVLSAVEPTTGLGDASDPLRVVNGPLASVSVAGPAAATAGEPARLALVGMDALGNPYTVQSDPDVVLDSAGGELPDVVATLDRRGEAELDVVFVGAGEVVVRASQGGALLGSSAPIAVGAGPTAALRITAGPWAWRDEPLPVRVEAVDTWGNRSDLTATATLRSRTTAADPLDVPLAAGVGDAEFTWPSTARPDTLDAASDGFEGSRDVIVVQRCVNGPTAALWFAGFEEGVACDAGGGTGVIVADLSASTRGFRPLDSWLASVDGALPVEDGTALPTVTLLGIGRHEVRGLAVDTVSCGAEVAGAAWLGRDDGTPTGTLALEPDAPDIGVFDSVAVDLVGAIDCARDPAAFASVGIRTDAGALDGVATGHGLELVLDAAGDGRTTLETSGRISGPAVTITAWSGDSAAGELLVPIDGDNVRPVVVDASPVGDGADLVDTFVVTFSEPLLAGPLTASAFTIGGVEALAADLDVDRVTVTAATPVDGSVGASTLRASSSAVRDLAGNRLAGTWAGTAADWTSAYGGAVGAPLAPSCDAFEPAELAFRPDGDPGEGVDAEVFAVAVSAPTAPPWWVLEVEDPLGALVFVDWTAPDGPSGELTWDGRGLDGRVLAAGTWRVSVSADDGQGNRSAPCGASVELLGPSAP